MTKLSFNESLLHLHGVSLQAAGVLLVMYQSADPTGAVGATGDDMRAQFSRTFGKRITTKTFQEAQAELLKRKLVPSLTAIHPPGIGEVDAEQAVRVKTVLDALEQDLSRVRPKEKPDHERVFAALVAFDALEVAARAKRESLAAPDGSPLVADGRRYHYHQYEWDYGLVQQWIRTYKLEHVLQTLSSLYASGALQKVQHDGTFKDKRTRLVAYLTAALRGQASTPSDRFANVRASIADLD